MNEQSESGIKLFLEGLGLNLKELHMEKTPARVSDLYEELFSGVHKDTKSIWGEVFPTEYTGLVSALEIPFYSICEHHLMPFYGTVDIVYQPKNGKVVGIGKMGKLVKLLAAKPQLQERFTKELADALENDLEVEGVLIRVKGIHLCMIIRGEMQPHTSVSTLESRGLLKDNITIHNEALAIIGGTKTHGEA